MNKKTLKPARTLSVNAKCSDLCFMSLKEPHATGAKILGEHDGYVPKWFPSPTTEHYGDYVELEIDVATGQILNWKKPTEAQLKETFNIKSTAASLQESVDFFGGIGASVDVEHRPGDMFNHSFLGNIKGIHDKYITVEDQDGDCWDCEVSQLSHNSDKYMH